MKPAVHGRDVAFRIAGGSQLAGDICISGSKNAALPEMAAALLTAHPVTLTNVPRVTDTRVMGQIITRLGGTCAGEGEVRIDAAGANSSDVPDELAKRMRATILLLGALV